VIGLPGDIETPVKLEASHSDMCRFDTRVKQDMDMYKKVRHGLRILYNNAREARAMVSRYPPESNSTAQGLSVNTLGR